MQVHGLCRGVPGRLFLWGDNMLVIHLMNALIAGCEPECPAEAIHPDTDDVSEKYLKWTKIFRNMAEYHTKGEPPTDAEDWRDKEKNSRTILARRRGRALNPDKGL